MKSFHCLTLILLGILSSSIVHSLPTSSQTHSFSITYPKSPSPCCLQLHNTSYEILTQAQRLSWETTDFPSLGYVVSGTAHLILTIYYCSMQPLSNPYIPVSFRVNTYSFDYAIVVEYLSGNCSSFVFDFALPYSDNNYNFWSMLNYPDPDGSRVNVFTLSTTHPTIYLAITSASLSVTTVLLDPSLSNPNPLPILNPWAPGGSNLLQIGITFYDPTFKYLCSMELAYDGTKYNITSYAYTVIRISPTFWLLNCQFLPPTSSKLVLPYGHLYTGSVTARPEVQEIQYVYVVPRIGFITESPRISSIYPKAALIGSNITITGAGFHPDFVYPFIVPFVGSNKLISWGIITSLTDDTNIVLNIPEVDAIKSNVQMCLSVSLNIQDTTDCNADSSFYYLISPEPESGPEPSPSPFPLPSPPPPLPVPSGSEAILAWLKNHVWIYGAAPASFLALVLLIYVLVYCHRRKKRVVYLSDRASVASTNTLINSNDGDVDSQDQFETKALININELTIKEMIGSGSFAVVYKGFWRKTEVAIKMLQNNVKNEKSSFLKETQLMLTLRHPNVVGLLGIVWNPRLCIVTEFCGRGDVAEVMLDKSFTVEPDHIRKICLDTCRGMTYLHGQNVIHRDLKARNLLIDKDWNIKVADFGLARAYSDQPGTMTACGTPTHAAPEVIKHLHYTCKADVYSFGICLWEMCVRQEPYESIPGFQVIVAVATKRMRPKIPANLDSQWSSLIRRCWTEDPDLRPQFQELVEVFEAMKLPSPLKKMPYREEDLIKKESRSESLADELKPSDAINNDDNYNTASPPSSPIQRKKVTSLQQQRRNNSFSPPKHLETFLHSKYDNRRRTADDETSISTLEHSSSYSSKDNSEVENGTRNHRTKREVAISIISDDD